MHSTLHGLSAARHRDLGQPRLPQLPNLGPKSSGGLQSKWICGAFWTAAGVGRPCWKA